MIEIFVTTDDTTEIPLASDPAMVRANPPVVVDDQVVDAPLARYRLTGDTDGLVVPDDAIRVVLRCLSMPELRQCERRAGRYSQAGQLLARRVLARTGELAQEGVAGARRVALAELTPEEADLWDQHNAWISARDFEVAALAILEVRHQGVSQPGPALVAEVRRRGTGLGEELVVEAAAHALRLATLGKVERPSSGSPSGPNTRTTPADGSAQGATASSGTAST